MMPRPSTLARLEDLEFLLDQGVPILEAVTRCGWTRPNSAEVTARRHDRPDLARALSREAKAQRRSLASV